jgi:hypothetical protein
LQRRQKQQQDGWGVPSPLPLIFEPHVVLSGAMDWWAIGWLLLAGGGRALLNAILFFGG